MPDRTFADIVFFFFLFPFSFVPFFFSLFFVYLFFFSFCYNFNPLILPGNDDGFFFFHVEYFSFRVSSSRFGRGVVEIRRERGRELFFRLMNETKEKKREKYAEWCDFFT